LPLDTDAALAKAVGKAGVGPARTNFLKNDSWVILSNNESLTLVSSK
jgi:hypothetical protein